MEAKQFNSEQSLQLKPLSEQLQDVNQEQLQKLLFKMIEIAYSIENTPKNLQKVKA